MPEQRTKNKFTPKCYKAQWPLSTTESQPYILIYREECGERMGVDFLLPATPEFCEQLFDNEHIRVFFLGDIRNGIVRVDKFVRHSEWM